MKNLTMSQSGLITVTLFAILMIWDGYTVYFGGGVQSSVSLFIINWFGFNPVPFYAGTIVGHLVCNMWPDTTELQTSFNVYQLDPSYENSARVHNAINDLGGMTVVKYWKKVFKFAAAAITPQKTIP